jgi:LacI family transcriptional regulator
VQSLGKQIPEDYSLVGVALGRESDLIIPPLTSIPWEGDEIGEMAARILIDKLNTKKPKITHILLPPKMEVRKSTRPRELRR